MGRSRGGLTTKIHASVNEKGLPLAFYLTPGQAHDAPPARHLLTQLQFDQYVLADKAYDADWLRQLIWEQGAIDVIPSKSNRKCPAEFDKEMYKKRNHVERFFGRIKRSFRRLATRYDKYATNFLAFIKLAAVRLWCQFYESAT
jgi:transposase